MAEDEEARVLLGQIGAAQGLRGEVRIQSFTADPQDIAAYGALSSEDGVRLFEITGLRPVKGAMVAARLKGVSDRTAAQALRGEKLYAPRSRLPPPGDDEYYAADLAGMKAFSEAGEAIGEILAVQNYGAGDLLEIRLHGSRRTELIPFTAAFVPEIDVAGRRLTVVLPAFDGEAQK